MFRCQGCNAQGIRLQVVDEAHAFQPQLLRQVCLSEPPAQVGQQTGSVDHRPGHAKAGTGGDKAAIGVELPDYFTKAGEIAAGVAALQHGFRCIGGAVEQSQAALGAADVASQNQLAIVGKPTPVG